MKSTTLTADQQEKMRAACERASQDGPTIMAGSYLPPTVTTANQFNILDPNKDNAVDNTYIVTDTVPANYIVSFSWNGDDSFGPVESAGEKIKVKVPPNLVIAAGDSVDQPIYVVYAVLSPDGPPVASEPLKLVVRKYVRPEYPAPVIAEAEAKPGSPYPLLDVAGLQANAKVTVEPWPGIAEGQKLWLNAVSDPPIKLTKWQGFPITTKDEQSTVIGIAALQTLKHDSSLTLKLEVSFDGGLTKTPFPHSTYKIINAKELDLPAPVVQEASNGVLNPIHVLNGAKATVAYADMLLTDSITLIWNGDKTSIGAESGNAAKSVDFNVPVNLIAAAMGKSIEVSYEVARDGKVLPSRKLTLSIGTLSEADLGQSKPVITEANGTTTLDLNKFTGDAHITVSKWPLAAVGQRVWLTVYGPTGAPLAQLLAGFPITDADGLNGIARALARAPLLGLAAGAIITVEIKVTFDGDTSDARATAFPNAQYLVEQRAVIVPPVITSVVDSNGILIPHESWSSAKSGRIYGTGTPSTSMKIGTNYTPYFYANVDTSGHWSSSWNATILVGVYSHMAIDEAGNASNHWWFNRIQ